MAIGTITFAEEFDPGLTDWTAALRVVSTNTEFPGVSYDTYIISGYRVHGQGDKKFQSNYITIQYGAGDGNGLLEDGESAYFQTVWDYTYDPNSGRWSNAQQIVRPGDYWQYRTYGIRKLKARGHGKALQFKITSDADFPFYINGWTVFVTGNQVT